MKEMADLQPGLTMCPVAETFITKHASPVKMIATDAVLYILYWDKSI